MYQTCEITMSVKKLHNGFKVIRATRDICCLRWISHVLYVWSPLYIARYQHQIKSFNCFFARLPVAICVHEASQCPLNPTNSPVIVPQDS